MVIVFGLVLHCRRRADGRAPEPFLRIMGPATRQWVLPGAEVFKTEWREGRSWLMPAKLQKY